MVLWAGVLNSYEQRAVSIKTSEILGRAKILVNQIVSNDYLNNTDSVIISAELQQLSNIYDGKIMRPATKYVGEPVEFKPVEVRK